MAYVIGPDMHFNQDPRSWVLCWNGFMGVVFVRASLPLLSRTHIFKKTHDGCVHTTYTSSQSAVLVEWQFATANRFYPPFYWFSFSLSTSSRVTRDRSIVWRRNKHQIEAFYFLMYLFIKIRCANTSRWRYKHAVRGRNFCGTKVFFPT